jgi:excisionase family DNA binding protein
MAKQHVAQAATADPIASDIPEVSSPNELAQHLGVSRRFIEEQVKAGRLRARKISPRAVRFFRSDVVAWLRTTSSVPVEA